MSQPSAAMALRESFGDRKLPDITRKITACVACRKLKIKCHMNDNKPPCTRCKTRGLSCTVNKSLQMLLENDATWKETMEQRIDKLERALMDVANINSSSRTASSTNTDSVMPLSQAVHVAGQTRKFEVASATPASASPNSTTLDLSCSLGAFPASSMINLTFTEDRLLYPGRLRPDLISCGIVSLETAEGLFSYYKKHLDPCIHCVIGDQDTLASTRAKSSLLTAAICTVAAFCTGSPDYQNCFKYFTKEVSGKLFASKNSFDDVRALFIGAFWLNEISSALNGLAVRIATELDLHRCITKMPHSKQACYDRTRPGAFLQSSFSVSADLNLVSQIELWSISSRVFDLFGADIESTAANQRLAELQQLRKSYDEWYRQWFDVFTTKGDWDAFSRRLFDLYFHSAKLYLFSHVFRGPVQENNSLPLQSNNDDSIVLARSALESALCIVRCIVDENEAYPRLEKLPLYFGTMIAFASVCLVKISCCHQQIIRDMQREDLAVYLRRLVDVLNTSLIVVHPTHPLLSIARSLENATNAQQGSMHEQEDVEHYSGFDFGIFTNDAMNLGLLNGQDDWSALGI